MIFIEVRSGAIICLQCVTFCDKDRILDTVFYFILSALLICSLCWKLNYKGTVGWMNFT